MKNAFTNFKNYLAALVFVWFGGQAMAQGILENTQLRFFTDVNFTHIDSAGRTKQPFEIGSIELLLTSQITDKLTFLGEVIHQPEGSVEIDRLMLKYQFNDYFHLSAGKLYVPIGLWNTTFYHQAKVLSPTIDLPKMIDAPDDYGVLDNKDEGIQFGGENLTKLRFGYRLFFANGFSAESNKPGINRLTYNVFIEPIDNLKFSFSGQSEKIKAGSTVSTGVLTEDVTVNMINASAMFLGGSSPFEFGTEYYRVYQKAISVGPRNFTSLFAYAGYKINKFTPYFYYDYVNYDQDMLVYQKNNYKTTALGLRYRLAPLSVIKFEAQLVDSDLIGKLNAFRLQWAVGF